MAARTKLPPVPPEVKTFTRAAKKLIADVAAYVVDGGDVLTHSKTEMKFFQRRDKVEDSMRKLGVESDAGCVALMAEVQKAVRSAPDAAYARRKRGYEDEIRRLDKEHRESTANMGGYEKEIRMMRNGRLP